MKDFLKAALVMGGMLALAMIVRVMVFVPLHSDIAAVKDPAPLATANGGCAAQQTKTPCLQHTDKGS